MPKIYPASIRNELKKLYVYSLVPLKTAAVQLGIHMRTANNWKEEALAAGDDWDYRRAIARSGTAELTQQILEDYTIMAQAIREAIRSEPELDAEKKARLLGSVADSVSKMARATSRMSPKIEKLDVANQVVGYLEEYVRIEKPECLECFEKILLPFSSFLVKKLK